MESREGLRAAKPVLGQMQLHSLLQKKRPSVFNLERFGLLRVLHAQPNIGTLTQHSTTYISTVASTTSTELNYRGSYVCQFSRDFVAVQTPAWQGAQN